MPQQVKNILFLHGGAGQEDFDADAKIVEALKKELGTDYFIHYPLLKNDETPDFGRSKQISTLIASGNDKLLIVAHSLGASMLLKYLSENKIDKKISGIFLLATPFWSGDEDWKQPLQLDTDFADKLNSRIPLFFYHCNDDEEVSFGHLAIYRVKIPWATFRELPVGGHQFKHGVTVITNDIRVL